MSVYAILKQPCPVYRDFWSKSGLCDIDSKMISENDFDQKLGILTNLTKKFCNFENFENFQKMRQSLVCQYLTKDCICTDILDMYLQQMKTIAPSIIRGIIIITTYLKVVQTSCTLENI